MQNNRQLMLVAIATVAALLATVLTGCQSDDKTRIKMLDVALTEFVQRQKNGPLTTEFDLETAMVGRRKRVGKELRIGKWVVKEDEGAKSLSAYLPGNSDKVWLCVFLERTGKGYETGIALLNNSGKTTVVEIDKKPILPSYIHNLPSRP